MCNSCLTQATDKITLRNNILWYQRHRQVEEGSWGRERRREGERVEGGRKEQREEEGDGGRETEDNRDILSGIM